jgi:D-amino-acid dehydrogenase
MDQKFDVVIIGGGVIGVCSAYYLSKSGLRVAVVEKNEIGIDCAAGNAGLISPSHFVPLAAPGMVKKGLKWMFNPESPFYIHPQLDAGLISWLWKYFRSCRKEQMERGMPVLRDLTFHSLQLFKEIVATEKMDFGFEHRGLLVLFNSEKGEMDNRHEAELAHRMGVDARMLNNAELNAVEPDVNITARGGLFYPNDAHCIPDQFVKQLSETAKKSGAAFFTQTEILSVTKEKSRIVSVTTAKETLRANEFVLAAGSWSRPMMRQLGIHLMVYPGKGYSVTIPRLKRQNKIPFILAEARACVTPMGDMLRFAGTLELSAIDLSINDRRVNAILKAIPKYLGDEAFKNIPKLNAWAGLRPCSPDGLPFVGRFEKAENLIAACGHSMLGLTLGPVTGKLVSEIIQHQKTTVETSSLRPDRF